MKLAISLTSAHYTNEQERIVSRNKQIIDWNLPCIPNEGNYVDHNLFNLSGFIEDEEELMWRVDYVRFDIIEGVLMPVIYLKGE